MYGIYRIQTVVFALLTGVLASTLIFWKVKKGIAKAFKALMGIVMVVTAFMMFKALFGLFSWFGIGGNHGFYPFLLLDIAVFALAIFVGSRITKKKAVNRMKDNVVLLETVKRAQELHATAIYVLQDCACLIYDQIPVDIGGYKKVEARTKEEYDHYVVPPMQISRLNIQDMSKIAAVGYRKYNYPDMDRSQREAFAKALCKKLSGYRCVEGGTTVTYFVPGSVAATGLTATATGYTVNYSESKDFTHSYDICTYHVLLLEDALPKAQPASATQKPMNQW